MRPLSRRDFLDLALTAPAGLASARAIAALPDASPADVHQQILELAPRPTMLGFAQFDFFPLEGARETFAEAKRLYEVAGAGDRLDRVEAAERHGLSLPLRTAKCEWFGRWLSGGRETALATEFPAIDRFSENPRILTDWIGD